MLKMNRRRLARLALAISLMIEEEAQFEEICKKKTKKPVVRSIWQQPWFSLRDEYPERTMYGLQLELFAIDDTLEIRNMLRMDRETFYYLLEKVEQALYCQDTHWRPCIKAKARLSVTLRYLAHGHSQRSLVPQYYMAKGTISVLLAEGARAIYEALEEEFLSTPQTEEDWQEIAELFKKRWNFPNCIGALDGKHVRIITPNNSGSDFFNYKHQFSIILMALVDANYVFRYVDVGAQGRIGDASVWRNCSLSKRLKKENLGIPDGEVLDGTTLSTPMVIVADDAFPMGEHIVKPFSRRHLTVPERVFNYRLSRARRVSENAFGILANRFRVLLTDIRTTPDRVINICLAAVALHNMLRQRCGKNYLSHNQVDYEGPDHVLVPGEWRKTGCMENMARLESRNPNVFSKQLRIMFQDYFVSSVGSVPWQWDIISNY